MQGICQWPGYCSRWRHQELHILVGIEGFVAEQNIVGVAVRCAARGRAITFSSTFAAFFTRTFDHLRMAAVSQTSANFCGSHCGVSLLVCCFLNEFNVGNIFLIKFVMGLLYPWVSSEVSRVCYSTIHATFVETLVT